MPDALKKTGRHRSLWKRGAMQGAELAESGPVLSRGSTLAPAQRVCCAARGLAGRLIPVPRALTADCGMAWRAEIDRRTALEALAAGEGLEVEGFYELTL